MLPTVLLGSGVVLNAAQMRGKLGKPYDSKIRDVDKRQGLSFSRVLSKWVNSCADDVSGQEGLE